MAKPRVIIADEDSNYIFPLQYKFVTEFFDKIDLEIITDREYYNELFSKPQNVKILIVSEELYDSSLQRHNIGNIFVMSESQDEGHSRNINVNKLFKYSSIKEIYNEIIGKSSGALNVDVAEKKESQIVLVTSAAGGVGKTTIALGVAASLAKNYKRVLYINASRLQSFQYMLDNATALASSEVYAKLTNPSDRIYEEIKHVIRKESFSYLPAFKASLMSLGINYSAYEKIALSAKDSSDYDFIIVDAESAFDEYKTKMIDIADKVIMITDQSLNGVHATNGFASNINMANPDKFIFVCNKFENDRYNALVAPDAALKYSINEYISRYSDDVKMSCEALSDQNEIRKVAFLVI